MKSSSEDKRKAENMDWTRINEWEFITKSHRRKNTRKRSLHKPEKKSTR